MTDEDDKTSKPAEVSPSPETGEGSATSAPKKGSKWMTPRHMSQKDRQKKYYAEMRRMNVRKPRRALTKDNVEAIKAVREHIKETLDAKWDKITQLKKLTKKQVEFARAFAANGRTNKLGAIRKAGYETDNPVIMYQIAKANLAIPGFEDLIEAFELEEKAKVQISISEVTAWFQRIATEAMATGDFTNANRAMENLAKYLGMFVERKEITHRAIHSREELDARINELTAVLKEAEPEIERRLRIN